MSHWVKHIKHSTAFFNDGYEAGITSGNLRYTTSIVDYKTKALFCQGKNLERVQEQVSNSLSFAQKTKSQIAIDIILAYQLAIMNLQGATSGKLSFHNDEMNEAEYLESCQKNQSSMAICQYHILKSMVLYLYEHYDEALTCALEAGKPIDLLAGQIEIAEHNFSYSLILAALYPSASAEEKKQYRAQWQSQ